MNAAGISRNAKSDATHGPSSTAETCSPTIICCMWWTFGWKPTVSHVEAVERSTSVDKVRDIVGLNLFPAVVVLSIDEKEPDRGTDPAQLVLRLMLAYRVVARTAMCGMQMILLFAD